MPFMIDVVSDVVCPWCYIGKHRLEAALRQLHADDPAFEPRINWHPFQLNPDLPAAGTDRKRYLEAKFGGPARAGEIYARVRAAGETAGIAFDFDRIAVQPNTLSAHRLVSWAQHEHDAGELVERLFAAYFIDGRDIGDHAVLAAIAGEAGLDASVARAHLDSGAGRDEIATMDVRARKLGVSGVPFFIFDGRVAVSGAHEPDMLIQAITQARETEEEASRD
ncbi:MAG: DsbA family oxidoreductase [Betaproteobacteria bacterium]